LKMSQTKISFSKVCCFCLFRYLEEQSECKNVSLPLQNIFVHLFVKFFVACSML